MNERITVNVEADLEDIIPIFLKNRQDDIGLLAQNVSAGNYDEIRVIGHSMKGAGGGYGFDYVTEIGQSLEEAAVDNDKDAIEALIIKLGDYLDKVDIVIQ